MKWLVDDIRLKFQNMPKEPVEVGGGGSNFSVWPTLKNEFVWDLKVYQGASKVCPPTPQKFLKKANKVPP